MTAFKTLVPFAMTHLPCDIRERRKILKALLEITPENTPWNDNIGACLTTLDMHERESTDFLLVLFPALEK